MWYFTWQNTKELNIKVLSTIVASGRLILSSLFPSKVRTARTISWYKLWPKIFLHMGLVIKFVVLPTGGLSISPSLGGSVAKANAPRVSIIKLTQSNWTAVRGADPENKEENLIGCSLKQIQQHCSGNKIFMNQQTCDACRNKVNNQSNNIDC